MQRLSCILNVISLSLSNVMGYTRKENIESKKERWKTIERGRKPRWRYKRSMLTTRLLWISRHLKCFTLLCVANADGGRFEDTAVNDRTTDQMVRAREWERKADSDFVVVICLFVGTDAPVNKSQHTSKIDGERERKEGKKVNETKKTEPQREREREREREFKVSFFVWIRVFVFLISSDLCCLLPLLLLARGVFSVWFDIIHSMFWSGKFRVSLC